MTILGDAVSAITDRPTHGPFGGPRSLRVGTAMEPPPRHRRLNETGGCCIERMVQTVVLSVGEKSSVLATQETST